MEYNFYVGSYARQGDVSISRYRADFQRGSLVRELSCTELDWPSYVLPHPNGKIVYAVRELTEEGAIHALEICGDKLVRRCTLTTGGNDPCNLCLDDENRFLFVADYSGSTVSVFSLDENGMPVKMVLCRRHEGHGPNPKRQTVPHPHFVHYRDGKLYICDLGTDSVYICAFDKSAAALTDVGRISFPAGAGPRHLVFHPRHPELVYVICELSSEIYLFRLENDCAELLQSVSTLPAGFTGETKTAAIKFSADGSALFASNRGHDSIALFSVSENGLLTAKQICPCGGQTPRDFSVFGEYLVCGNQDSDLITVLHFDAEKCALAPCPMTISHSSPTAIMKAEV